MPLSAFLPKKSILKLPFLRLKIKNEALIKPLPQAPK
jgi:hypothetical protein